METISKAKGLVQDNLLLKGKFRNCESCGKKMNVFDGEIGFDEHVIVKRQTSTITVLGRDILGRNGRKYYCLDCAEFS